MPAVLGLLAEEVINRNPLTEFQRIVAAAEECTVQNRIASVSDLIDKEIVAALAADIVIALSAEYSIVAA